MPVDIFSGYQVEHKAGKEAEGKQANVCPIICGDTCDYGIVYYVNLA